MKTLRINTGSTRNEIDRTDHMKSFIRTLYGGKPMSKEDENNMFREYMLTKNPVLKDTIIKCNMRFVFSAAKAFTNDPEMVLDLTMEGMMGLLEAFDRFDPETGNSFLSYANHYVYKYMVEYVHEAKQIKRSTDSSLKSKVSKIRENFFAKTGRYPSDDEIIDIIKEKYGIDVKKEDYIRDIVILSIDSEYRTNDGDDTPSDGSHGIISKNDGYCLNDYDVKSETEYRNDRLNAALSILSDRDREIIKKLFGIGYFREYVVEELADEYGMTVARINQIRKTCIEKIRSEKKYLIAS